MKAIESGFEEEDHASDSSQQDSGTTDKDSEADQEVPTTILRLLVDGLLAVLPSMASCTVPSVGDALQKVKQLLGQIEEIKNSRGRLKPCHLRRVG